MSPSALLLAALLAAPPAAAQPPARALTLKDLLPPPGYPPEDRLAKVRGLDRGFTLNAEVLERHGFTLDEYQKLDSGEQQRVFEWVRLLERERLLGEARGAAAVEPEAPQAQAAWTPEKQAALDRVKGASRTGARLFDGAQGQGGSGGAALVPDVELLGAPFTLPDGTVGPGLVRRFSLTAPGGLKLEYGHLGADGRSPLVETSPYLGLSKEGGSGKGALDYEYKWSVNAVNLGARLYDNDAPALDARMDAGIDSLRTLDPQWGLSAADVAKMHDGISFSTDFERQWLLATSAMGRVGRAWTLTPGLDAGCSAMGLVRVTGIFPSASLDQTCGARFALGPDSRLGVFAGVTEGIGLFDRSAIADSLDAGTMKLHVHPDVAPHGELVLWGKLPYLSNAEYTLAGGKQLNPWTTVTSLSAGASVPAGAARVGAFGSYSDESGPDLEFERRKSAAGVSVTPKPGLDVWAQYMQDSAQYGAAQMDSKGVLLGVTLKETQGPAQGARLTMESLFGGAQSFSSADQQAKFLDMLQTDLRLLQQLKDAGLGLAGGPGAAWQSVQDAYNGLSPDVRQLLGEAWHAAAPGAPPLSQIVAIKPPDFATINKLVDLLSDTQVMERLLVRAVRHQVLQQLEKTEIPILGRKVRLSAPMVLAAANAYSLSLTPIPPVTNADARNALDPFLLGKLSGAAGCAGGPQPQATTDCILKSLPRDAQDTIKTAFGNDINALLKAAVAWPSDVLRREMDRMALQVILAAETLNDLSVDKGERIADLNVRGMMKSFQYLDERRRRSRHDVLDAAARDLRRDLEAEEGAMRAQLEEYGSARLSWLKAQSAWPSNVQVAVRTEDWAPLLAVYGDAKLFDLILRCKGRMAQTHASAPARLLITFDRSGGPLNAVTAVRGNPAELRLPPRGSDLSALDLSFLN